VQGSRDGHGSGLVEMDVDFETGRVTAARMLKSTGSAQSDEVVLAEFRKWQFKPRTVRRVKTPITLVLRSDR
jgi:TonB family protein